MPQDNVRHLPVRRGRPLGRNAHLDHAVMNLHGVLATAVAMHAQNTEMFKEMSRITHDAICSLNLARTVHDNQQETRKAA